MSDISIRRQHGKSRAEARAAAEHMSIELGEEFDLECTWEGDTVRFKRPGISGRLAVDDRDVTINIRLGFLFLAVKPSIEREVHKFFDENFPATC